MPEKCDIQGCGADAVHLTRTFRSLCMEHSLARLKYAREVGGWDDGKYVEALKEWEALHDKAVRA